MADARYDGHADWYDATFRSLSNEAGSAGLLCRLLGPADTDDPVCLDIGCGTGLHASIPAIAMTFTHTDVDDFAAALAEAARVLRPGGQLVYLGLHPAYVGAFVERVNEVERRELSITAGYGDERLQRDPTGRFPVRSRVGARHLTLGTFLGAFLAQHALRLSSIDELDTNMQPWQPHPSDGRVVPLNIAVTARAVIPTGPKP